MCLIDIQYPINYLVSFEEIFSKMGNDNVVYVDHDFSLNDKIVENFIHRGLESGW